MVAEREIGIRVALGASRSAAVRTLLVRGVAIVGGGAVVGVAGGALVARLVASTLFGVAAHDPRSFAAAVILIAITSLVALLVPARRAARIDPAELLRG